MKDVVKDVYVDSELFGPDHLGVSALTSKKRATATPSSILAHLSETGHTAFLHDFKIFSSCSSPSELLVRESLLISKS